MSAAPIRLNVGDKVRFYGDAQRYTVRASNDRFAVCTKPFNPKRTVIYTVVDLVEHVRGTEDLVFCKGAETAEQCAEMLARLAAGETEVSHRNRVTLRIESVQPASRVRAFAFTETVAGFSGWVKATTRAKARMLIARGLADADWCTVGHALPRIKSVRLDPRADGAPVCGRGPAGLVHAGWKPSAEGGAP